MRTIPRFFFAVAIGFAAPLVLPAGLDGAAMPLDEQSQSSRAADAPVATIGPVAITEAQLEEIVGSQLIGPRSQEYNLKRQAVEDLISRALLEQEAATRGISLEELLRVEVDGKVAPATEASDKAAYQQRRSEFLKELRTRASVHVFLEPPRIAVSADGPSKGPASAPVTIVEFSDFQCPFCRQVGGTLRKLEERYRDNVRFVFRDFPLAIHKDAPKAAEAAACAREQERFWEMHDRLFENQANLQVANLKRYASEIVFDPEQFDRCLDSGKYTAQWREGMNEGSRNGVTGTPSFFINGRLLVGAKPFESFVEIIDDELDRLTTTAAAPKQSQSKPRQRQ